MTDGNGSGHGPAEVVLELYNPGAGWRRIGAVRPTEATGSVCSDGPRRDVYLFGWLDGSPGVWRSLGGVDVESPEVRVVHSLGFERVADLRQVEAFDLELRRPGGRTLLLRFHLEAST